MPPAFYYILHIPTHTYYTGYVHSTMRGYNSPIFEDLQGDTAYYRPKTYVLAEAEERLNEILQQNTITVNQIEQNNGDGNVYLIIPC